MRLDEFTAMGHEDEVLAFLAEFRATGVRCMAKEYDDLQELDGDAHRIAYRVNKNAATRDKYRWLRVMKRGSRLVLVNEEVD